MKYIFRILTSMLNIDISELVNTDASHMTNPLRMSILPCKAMACMKCYNLTCGSRLKFDILTADFESTCKTGPDGISYIMC